MRYRSATRDDARPAWTAVSNRAPAGGVFGVWAIVALSGLRRLDQAVTAGA